MSEIQIKAERDVSIFGDVVGRDKITINLPAPLPPAEAKDRANLLILLHKVKTFWIEGVLEKSVHNAVLLELGKETKPEAVDHPWGMVLELPDQTSQVLSPGTKIIDIFEKMNRALLILGEPGSGKTITLLELARDLIARAETDLTKPIPVVFNLSSWANERQTVHDWLIFELSTKYQIPKKIGRAWLEDNRILPLLDGFDEVKPENRVACVEAINHFSEIFGLFGGVICSRVKEYTALPARLKLNGAIYLQPLTIGQVNIYLEAGGSKLAVLRSMLQKDEALQELALSPLILNIMCLAYKNAPIETFSKQSYDQIEDRRKHLFDVYIARMFKRKGKNNRSYSPQQTIDWLSWFARNLLMQSQTIFTGELLQPSWLQTKYQKNLYAFFSMVIAGSIVGLISGFLLQLSLELFNKLSILIFDLEETNSWSVRTVLLSALSCGLIGLFTGLIIGLIKRKKIIKEGIKSVDALQWSWARVRNEIRKRYRVWAYEKTHIPGGWSGAHMAYPRLVNEFARSLANGLQSAILVDKRSFNQSIQNSLKNAVVASFLGILYGLLYGCFYGLILGLLNMFTPMLSQKFKYIVLILLPILSSLILAICFGVVGGLRFGGFAFIKHYVMRFICSCKKYTPWKYPRFLDYAVSINFLQKVGGGYIFIHRLLLEHFAAISSRSNIQNKTVQ